MIENGFVLLTDESFDNEKLISDLQSQWHISVEGAGNAQASFAFSVGGTMCMLALMPAPIPNNEAVYRAQGNYYCRDAVDIAKVHQAHLMVTLMGDEDTTNIDCMKLYSKIIASCLSQSNATGVYTSGTVFSADFYQKCAQQYLRSNEIPLMIWVFIGVEKNQIGSQLYTIGMEKFQKSEMEILNCPVDVQTLQSTLLGICGHVISADVVFKDGETLSFSAEQKWAITRSESIRSQSEFSLKLKITDVNNVSPQKTPQKPTSSRNNTQTTARQRTTTKRKERQNGAEKSNIFVKILVISICMSVAGATFKYYKKQKKREEYRIAAMRRNAEGLKEAKERDAHMKAERKKYEVKYGKSLSGFPSPEGTLQQQYGLKTSAPDTGFSVSYLNTQKGVQLSNEVVQNIHLDDLNIHIQNIPSNQLAAHWVGRLTVDKKGAYRFPVRANKGSHTRVFVDQFEVANEKDQAAAVMLKKGNYLLEVEYTNQSDMAGLDVSIERNGKPIKQQNRQHNKQQSKKQPEKFPTLEALPPIPDVKNTNGLSSFPANNQTLVDRLPMTVTPPRGGGFNAYYFNASDPNNIISQEHTKAIKLDFSYKFKGIPSESFIGYWVATLAIDKDGYYQFPIDYSWADVTVNIDGHDIIKERTHAPKKNQRVYLTKGEYLLQVRYKSMWHTVHFSMDIKGA